MACFTHFPNGSGRDGYFSEEVVPIDPNVCGTTACFAGHGPNAGIPPEEHENWDEYVKRVFLSTKKDSSPACLSPYFHWLFGAEWESSIPEAVKRAAYLLEHGEAPKFGEEECWDEDKEEYVTRMEIHDKEAWEKFTPNLALLEQIAKGEASVTGEQA